jgi:opacity protein-like surface antigen
VVVAAKGGSYPARERWTFQAALGASGVRNDRFIGRLTDFGFQDSLNFGVPRFSLDAMRVVGRHLAIGFELASLDERVFRRQSTTTFSGQDERYWWATYELGAFVLVDDLLWRGRLVPYARGGIGLTLARTSYQESDANTHVVTIDDRGTDFGYALRMGAGLGVMPWRRFGCFVEANATYAPTITFHRGSDRASKVAR